MGWPLAYRFLTPLKSTRSLLVGAYLCIRDWLFMSPKGWSHAGPQQHYSTGPPRPFNVFFFFFWSITLTQIKLAANSTPQPSDEDFPRDLHPTLINKAANQCHTQMLPMASCFTAFWFIPHTRRNPIGPVRCQSHQSKLTIPRLLPPILSPNNKISRKTQSKRHYTRGSHDLLGLLPRTEFTRYGRESRNDQNTPRKPSRRICVR